MSRSARGGPAAAPDGTTEPTAPRNEVVLVGRVPALPEERELPSGDVLVTWRVVVGRPPGRRPPEGVRATTVDTLDCVAWTASARRAASALLPDDVVEVSGALRRRFWRAGAGAASRCEVEVSTVRRVSRRPPRPAAPSG
jgi:single-strand DNA-binding protein